MKVVQSIALVLILIVSVVLSDPNVAENVVKLNSTQPIQPRAPEKRSSKYAKIKAAREAAERKLKELAAELEQLKNAETEIESVSSSESSSAQAPLRAPEPVQGLAAPAPAQGLAAPAPAKLPKSEIVDMDALPVPQRKQRRVVTKRVTSKKKTKAQEDWDAAHHDVHEYDSSHWVEVDGEMTRLHIKSQTGETDDLTYHGSDDEFALKNGSHGHKIPHHEIAMEQRTRTKRRTNITKRPRRKTTEGLHGGFQAPQPTFYGMWTGENLNGGYKAPVPGVYGGSSYKHDL